MLSKEAAFVEMCSGETSDAALAEPDGPAAAACTATFRRSDDASSELIPAVVPTLGGVDAGVGYAAAGRLYILSIMGRRD